MPNEDVAAPNTVVVIEDDAPIAAALRGLFEPEGYNVVIVSNARQALGALRTAAGGSVLLLDPLVPGVTPAALLRGLKEGHTLITIAVAVYPIAGDGPPPDDPRRPRRLVSPALLLEMVRKSFAERHPRSAGAALSRAG